jgi:hypothetical protein
MSRRSVLPLWLFVPALVGACALFPPTSPTSSAAPLPAASAPVASDPTGAVESALAASGLNVVSASDVSAREANQSCGPTQPVRVLSIGYGTPPGSSAASVQPTIQVLIFGSTEERRTYQERISGDGTTVNGSTCTDITDYALPPHWSGGGNDLLLVVTDDPTVMARVAAATARLGPP